MAAGPDGTAGYAGQVEMRLDPATTGWRHGEPAGTPEMRGYFRPEFLNRLDEIVLFKPLTLAEIERIVDLMLADVRSRLADRQMKLEVRDGAKHFIAEQGFDPVYGARPLRRFIARQVETPIGRVLLAGDVRDGAVIRVDYTGGELAVSYENPS